MNSDSVVAHDQVGERLQISHKRSISLPDHDDTLSLYIIAVFLTISL